MNCNFNINPKIKEITNLNKVRDIKKGSGCTRKAKEQIVSDCNQINHRLIESCNEVDGLSTRIEPNVNQKDIVDDIFNKINLYKIDKASISEMKKLRNMLSDKAVDNELKLEILSGVYYMIEGGATVEVVQYGLSHLIEAAINEEGDIGKRGKKLLIKILVPEEKAKHLQWEALSQKVNNEKGRAEDIYQTIYALSLNKGSMILQGKEYSYNILIKEGIDTLLKKAKAGDAVAGEKLVELASSNKELVIELVVSACIELKYSDCQASNTIEEYLQRWSSFRNCQKMILNNLKKVENIEITTIRGTCLRSASEIKYLKDMTILMGLFDI